jgi:hypothetical protein
MNMICVNIRANISTEVGRLLVPWLNFEVSMFEGWANEMGLESDWWSTGTAIGADEHIYDRDAMTGHTSSLVLSDRQAMPQARA